MDKTASTIAQRITVSIDTIGLFRNDFTRGAIIANLNIIRSSR